MSYPGREIVEKLRKEYPKGSRIRLLEMDDSQAPPVGTEGTVLDVDDIGSLVVHWDNGSSLNVVYEIDRVEKINRKDSLNEKFQQI